MARDYKRDIFCDLCAQWTKHPVTCVGCSGVFCPKCFYHHTDEECRECQEPGAPEPVDPIAEAAEAPYL